ncbi:hypothetical protein DFH11DRAFT_1754336 [Phellopilus nigrolimitatus]|nr:hypothetical protein DFH11DRAFT_1754336 [Phellopilus nigrolimitatus]
MDASSDKDIKATNNTATQTTMPSKRRRSPLATLVDALPAWAGEHLRSKHSWKILVRCWVASFAAFVLILPDRSLKALGNAAFFTILASLIVPPNMPVQMFFFAISLMIVGMMLGWGLGAATMRAGLAVRNQTLLKSAYQRAQEGAAGAANPDAIFTLDVFKGFFLDTRSTVVYGVLFGVFSFFFAIGRAYRPRLVIFFTFAQVFLDILCTFGPLFPAAEYNIMSSMLISVGSYMAIGVVCCIFIFPETMNHSYLALVTKLLGSLKDYGEMYGSVLELSPEEIVDDKDDIVGRSVKQRLDLITMLKELEQKSGLINAEFSWGRWNGNDAKGLEEPLRILIARMGSFYSFPKLLSMYTSTPLSRSTTSSGDTDTASSTSVSEDVAGDTELIRQLHSRRVALEAEHGVRMTDILPPLRESTAALRAACVDALGAAGAVVAETNTRRWKHGSTALAEKEAALDTAEERLRSCAEAYKAETRFAVVEPFLPMLRAADEDADKRKQLPIRSLVVASAFASQLVVTVDGIMDLLEVIRTTSNKRKKARLWAPGGLRAIGNFFLRRGKGSGTEKALGEGSPPEVDHDEKKEDASYKRDPDSRPPTNAFQKFMNGVHSIYLWAKTPEAMFAAKYTTLSILLWLPAIFPTSAYFYYVEKGVWALIMGQTSMTVYASDQIYDAMMRISGTVAGLATGLLAWYIGNGHGNGNPYGAAAAFGVFLIPVVFLRINAPPAKLVTLALIVGYSWIDGHLATVGNPGIGWSIAWKRFVLVMIGYVASFFFMIIPPTSGRKSVRLRNAAAISELSGIYASLMSVWISDEETRAHADGDSAGDEKAADRPKSDAKPPWAVQYRSRALELMEELAALQMRTGTAVFEGGIRGAWPAAEYNKLLSLERDMLSALGQLSSALHHLDPSWRVSLNRRTMILNPNFITDVMSTFALVSQSLRTGEPMHQILPSSLLDRLLYHHSHDAISHAEQEQKASYVERITSLEFIYFSTGITAVSQVIQALDEMHRITKKLCGEVPFRGFSEWRDEYERAYGSA